MKIILESTKGDLSEHKKEISELEDSNIEIIESKLQKEKDIRRRKDKRAERILEIIIFEISKIC